MREKIKKALRSDLIKVSSKTGVATAIRIGASFVISKILAIFVGPSGLAILGQLANASNILQSLSTGGITVGVTKYISEYSDSREKQINIINTSLKLTFLCSAICSLGALLSYKFLGYQLFQSNKYDQILLILGITLILFSFNSLITAIINGLRNFKLYVIINISTSIISLLTTLVFVYWLGVYGALLSLVLSPAVIFFISWFLVRKEDWLNYRFFKIPFDRKSLKLLSTFSLMAINNAIVGAIAQIAIRSLITRKMNIDVAGIWDGMNKLSAGYMLLITTSIQVYYLPTLSFIKDKELLWKEIIKTEKIILPLSLLLFSIIYLFRGIIINLLFTKEFFLMKSIFAYQLFGDLIKIASWILSYTMYAKAMAKQLIITDNLFTLIYVVFSYFLMKALNYGLDAVYFAYIINNIIYLIFMYFFMKKYTSSNYV